MKHDYECIHCDDCCGRKAGTFRNRYCTTDPTQTCTNIKTIMDYFQVNLMIISKKSSTKHFFGINLFSSIQGLNVNAWSCCSNADFAEFYNNLGPDNFCLSPHAGSGNFLNKSHSSTILHFFIYSFQPMDAVKCLMQSQDN